MPTKIDVYKTTLWLAAVLILIYWICMIPCPFQKGGVDDDVYFKVFLFNLAISILVTLLVAPKNSVERFVGWAIISIVAFIISTFAIMIVIDAVYGDKTWFLWENKHRVFINSVYYGMIFGINILLWKIYLHFFKKPNLP
ncbi:hypothetical protein [Ferruginibacter sp.]